MAMCLSLFVPAFATEETPTIFSTDYVDALGDKYTLTCEDNDGHITSTILNADGDIVSKAEAVRGEDEIIVYDYQEVVAPHSRTTTHTIESTTIYHLQDFLVDDSEQVNTDAQNLVSPLATNATIPGSSSYTYQGTYNSNITFLGKILTGDCYYRRVGTYSTYNRHSYAFERGVKLSAIVAAVSVAFSALTGSTVPVILGGLGISFVGSALTTDVKLNCEIHAFDFQFKCQMKFDNRTYNMCEISRKMEYIYIHEEYLDTDTYQFDMTYYSTPDAAVTAYCKEAVGYSEQAFEAKFINQSKPNLSLPVSGPVWP